MWKEGLAATVLCVRYNDARLQLIVSSLYLSGACTGLFAAHWARKYGRKVSYCLIITNDQAGCCLLNASSFCLAAFNHTLLSQSPIRLASDRP